jgi:hypothetical protein
VTSLVLVVGDTKPDLNFRVKRAGEPVNLTGCTVLFRLRKPSGAVVEKTLSIVGDATTGRVAGSFGIADLNESGKMLGELVVLFADGTVQHAIDPFDVTVRAEFGEAIR